MIDSHFKELANVGHIVVSLNLLWVIKTSVCIALYFSSYRFGAHEFQRRGPVGMLMGNSGSSWNDMWWSEKLSVESILWSGSTCLVMEGGSSICGCWHLCFVFLFWKLTTTPWLLCMRCTVHVVFFCDMVVKTKAFSLEISLSFRSTPYKWYKLEHMFSLRVSDGESRKHECSPWMRLLFPSSLMLCHTVLKSDVPTTELIQQDIAAGTSRTCLT